MTQRGKVTRAVIKGGETPESVNSSFTLEYLSGYLSKTTPTKSGET